MKNVKISSKIPFVNYIANKPKRLHHLMPKCHLFLLISLILKSNITKLIDIYTIRCLTTEFVFSNVL